MNNKKRVRITSRVDEDGNLRLKVYVDDVLVSESIANGTVTVETDV